MIRSKMSRLVAIAVVVGMLTVLVPATPAVAATLEAPSPRDVGGMAFDAAHGQVVMFGGFDPAIRPPWLADTWTWDGTVWTKRSPAHSPSPRSVVGMAYDAAQAEVVLFGGYDGRPFGDTWTWDGTDWTQRTPVHSPSARSGMGMAYDAARAQVVLFGGNDDVRGHLNETWSWDGSDWTKRTPAHAPPVRSWMGMAYDSANGQIVVFGGMGLLFPFADTWTWDGADWTKRAPAHSPPHRESFGMAYDAASGQVVIFGGQGTGNYIGDTWTWNGGDWKKRKPAHHPSPRYSMRMVYDDAHGQVVSFGGQDRFDNPLGDTWTWAGTDWALGTAGMLRLTLRSGPPGTLATVHAKGLAAGELVRVTFIDSTQGTIFLRKVQTGSAGAFTTEITIPSQATPGTQRIKAKGRRSGEIASRRFTVT